MNNSTILIVDDREFDRILYKEYLDNKEYTFIELDDGTEVYNTLMDNNIDLILLDWQMPRVNGLEVLKRINASNKLTDIPIIVITGLEDEAVLEEAFVYGSMDFLNKPVSKIELSARVRSALNLYYAKKKLSKQKGELEELNSIIKEQKTELEKSLHLKTELIELKEQQFEKEIDSSNRSLLSKEMDSNLIKKQMKEAKKIYDGIYSHMRKNYDDPDLTKELRKMERIISGLLAEQDDNENFKRLFESISPDFFKTLTSISSKLTPLDLKHCAYIKLNLDNYEISRLANVEIKSIQMTRYRIRKKLQLDEDTSLREYILQI